MFFLANDTFKHLQDTASCVTVYGDKPSSTEILVEIIEFNEYYLLSMITGRGTKMTIGNSKNLFPECCATFTICDNIILQTEGTMSVNSIRGDNRMSRLVLRMVHVQCCMLTLNSSWPISLVMSWPSVLLMSAMSPLV